MNWWIGGEKVVWHQDGSNCFGSLGLKGILPSCPEFREGNLCDTPECICYLQRDSEMSQLRKSTVNFLISIYMLTRKSKLASVSCPPNLVTPNPHVHTKSIHSGIADNLVLLHFETPFLSQTYSKMMNGCFCCKPRISSYLSLQGIISWVKD